MSAWVLMLIPVGLAAFIMVDAARYVDMRCSTPGSVTSYCSPSPSWSSGGYFWLKKLLRVNV